MTRQRTRYRLCIRESWRGAERLGTKLRDDPRFADVVVDRPEVHVTATTHWANEIDIILNLSDVAGHRIDTSAVHVMEREEIAE